MNELSRRGFLEVTAGGLAASAVVRETDVIAQQSAPGGRSAPRTMLRVVVNGREREGQVEDRLTLAEFLRDELHLTGTKVGCDRGECGACTVLLDGAPIYACSYLAVWTAGRSVETVEGLAAGERLHPLQQAFIDHDAPQCGFCTSGQLMSAKALLAATPRPSADAGAERAHRESLPLLELQPLRGGCRRRGCGVRSRLAGDADANAPPETRRQADSSHRRREPGLGCGQVLGRRAAARHAARARSAQPASARQDFTHPDRSSTRARGRQGDHHPRKLSRDVVERRHTEHTIPVQQSRSIRRRRRGGRRRDEC